MSLKIENIDLLTKEFFAKYHQERVGRNIYLKAIWSKDQANLKKVTNFLTDHLKEKREIRIAPTDKKK